MFLIVEQFASQHKNTLTLIMIFLVLVIVLFLCVIILSVATIIVSHNVGKRKKLN
jgi:flagellar basal body-associated protein FliL